MCSLVYALVLGTAPVGVEGYIGGTWQNGAGTVPLLGAQHLERKQGNHKQSMAPGVSAGSLEGYWGRERRPLGRASEGLSGPKRPLFLICHL